MIYNVLIEIDGQRTMQRIYADSIVIDKDVGFVFFCRKGDIIVGFVKIATLLSIVEVGSDIDGPR